MLKSFVLILFFSIASSLYVSANAATEALQLNRLQIVTEQFPPFNYRVNGVLKGASVEIIQALLVESKLDANISLYPWARAYEIAKHSPNVLIFSIAKTPNRLDLFQWGGAIVPVESCFFALESRKDIEINTIEDALKYKVITQREGSTQHILKAFDFIEGKNLVSSVSATSSYLSLITGRADLWGYPTQVVKNVMSQENNKKNAPLRKAFCFDVSYLYVAFSHGTPQKTIDDFNQALAKFRQTKKYQMILKKYDLQI